MAKAKRINWKQRAADAEEALLAAEETRLEVHKRMAHVAFALEKEKALRRRADEHANRLDIKLHRALTLIHGAAENLAGRGQLASSDALHLGANDLRSSPRPETDGCALTPMTAKDEQI